MKDDIAKYKEKIKKMTLMSDVFMREVLNDKETIEYVIQIILDNKNLKVEEINTQADYKNLQGKSLKLDIVAVDSNGTLYNIEVQNDDKGAIPKRARYHSSLLDLNSLKEGQKEDELPNSYIIFITKNDTFGYGKLEYVIERRITGIDENFDDGSKIIYINTAIKDNSEKWKLMHDFICENPDDMICEPIKKRVGYFKNDLKGGEKMCDIVRELVEEGKNEGKIEGKIEARLEAIVKFFNIGVTIDKISEAMNLSESEIKNILIASGVKLV